jgi:high-affinity iron transporter
MAAFLVMLREGVEAALIVAILLAYVRHFQDRRPARLIWGGTLTAAAISIGVGVILFATVGELEGKAEEITEGIIAFAAAGLLTWMIFWMGKQARAMRGKLETQVDLALSTGGLALASVAFVAVLREGLESALFLISTTVGDEASGGQLVGGLLGVLLAVGIGYGIYRGGRRLNLRLFFRVTGLLLILFAAGLVSTGIHELQEAGVFPTIVEHLWTISFAAPEGNNGWAFLKSLIGWRHNPSLLMVAAYFTYLIPVGRAYLNATSAAPTVKESV